MSDPAPEPPPRPTYPPFTGLPDLPAIRTLRGSPQWVAWRLTLKYYSVRPGRPERPPRWTKPLTDAKTGGPASHSDPATWATPEVAEAFALRENFDGVGFALTKLAGKIGIDLDKCRDPATGELNARAAEVVALGETYCEVSPSGRGLRLFAEGTVPKAEKSDAAGVEVYGELRYLTVTGRHVPGTPTEIRPAPKTLALLSLWVRQAQEKAEAEAAARREAEGRPEPKPRPEGSAEGGFHANVNAAAFAATALWVPILFNGYAKRTPAGGWRVTSADLCRDHEEDLSLAPTGFVDFGLADMGDERKGRRSALDLVMEWSELFGHAPKRPTLLEAARWLCDRLGVTPEAMGYAPKERKKPERRGANDARPVISVRAGAIGENVDQMESALIERGGIYQRGDAIVGVGQVPITVASEIETKALRVVQKEEWAVAEAACSAACFMRYDARADEEVIVNPPMPLVKTLMARRGALRLPPLVGVVTAPTLRPDGTVLDAPGYDRATGLFYEPGSTRFPPIPPRPTREDAVSALALLDELIAGFPFVAGEDRSVALSGFLTACVRATLPTAPLHGFSAPVRGSGKTKLSDVASVIATGRPASAVAHTGDEVEMEKRLTGLLLQGAQVATLDNATAPIDGVFLNMVLSQPVATVRPLGGSRMVDVPSGTFLTVNGNGLVILGDLTRRTIVCNLDPRVERPELRRFAFEPVERAETERGRLVVAVLTVLLAHRAAGAPQQAQPLGSFEAWSVAVRDPLLWLGCADPLLTMTAIQEDDPEKAELDTVLTKWSDKFGEDRVTVAQIIERVAAYDHAALRADLLNIAGMSGSINSRRLGKWLSGRAKRRSKGRWVEQDGTLGGSAVWRLRTAD